MNRTEQLYVGGTSLATSCNVPNKQKTCNNVKNIIFK